MKSHAFLSIGVASVLGVLTVTPSHANDVVVNPDATSPSPPCRDGVTCSIGSATLHGEIRTKFGTEIDSGWFDADLVKIRTRFTIDPPPGSPLVTVDMTSGAVVEASWPERGFINLRALSRDGNGVVDVRYTLVPSLEASIYGIGLNLDATSLINRIPGAHFDYDVAGRAALLPWGFQGAAVEPPVPALDQSTIFGLGFDTLGIDAKIVTGALSIQAAAKPRFDYRTREVRLDSGILAAEGGVTKIPIGDADALDLGAAVIGDVALAGALEVRPVVSVASVGRIPTFGLVNFSFTAVTKEIGGESQPVTFQNTTIHIPLPNIKVPKNPVGLGDASAGGRVEKKVTIDSTGELGGVLTFESSDPQFIVPRGEVRVGPREKYALEIAFEADSDSPASATITVRSNDPDSPEQTFKVGANGALLGEDDKPAEEAEASDGCGCRTAGSAPASSGLFGLSALVGLALAGRRRRSR
jgi:MYXO-CTERM domain-containing protein